VIKTPRREYKCVIDLFQNLHVEMLVRLLLAAILGLTIGLERELKRKSLGLKTILVISIVSCLLTIVSVQSAYILPEAIFNDIRMDPLRLAAQIVSGVGFLGAGVILKREDDTVSGLTTAAIVWGAAGIGIATGSGFYTEAIAGVTLLLVSVELIPAIIRKMGFQRLHIKQIYLQITLDREADIQEVMQRLETYVLKADHIKMNDLADGTFNIVLLLVVQEQEMIPDIYQKIARIQQIKNFELRA